MSWREDVKTSAKVLNRVPESGRSPGRGIRAGRLCVEFGAPFHGPHAATVCDRDLFRKTVAVRLQRHDHLPRFRSGIAAQPRTAQPERIAVARPTGDPDLPPFEDIAAGAATEFLRQAGPRVGGIDSAQDAQSMLRGEIQSGDRLDHTR